jgi:hypothetical protein
MTPISIGQPWLQNPGETRRVVSDLNHVLANGKAWLDA